MAIIRDVVDNLMLLIDLAPDRMFVVMSDSDKEKRFCTEVVEKAHGDVLLLGFGLGFILIPIMNKPEVTSVTVIEINQEVLDLVASQLVLNDKVSIHLADAMTYVPDKQYDVIWFDADISPDQFKQYRSEGVDIYLRERMQSYLKTDGVYLEWNNDGN